MLGLTIATLALVVSIWLMRKPTSLSRISGLIVATASMIYLVTTIMGNLSSISLPEVASQITRQIALFLSGNVVLDGVTIFTTVVTFGLVSTRAILLIRYEWFFREGSGVNDEKFHEAKFKKVIRWGFLYWMLLMLSIEVASWLARLPKI